MRTPGSDIIDSIQTSSVCSVDDPSSNTKSIKYLLITHGESYVGYNLAMHLTEELTKREGQLKKKNWKVRVLCQDKKNSQDLEKRGIEVKEVDYESQSMIREQMKDHIKACIFNPFPKQKTCFLEQGKNILESANHMKVKRIIMVSKVGCSQYKDGEGSDAMGKFNVLEEHLRRTYKYGYWAIFRVPMIQQFFYFWSKMIESKSVIGMPISESNLLQTANIKDVCNCLSQSALSKKSLVWINQSQETYGSRDSIEDFGSQEVSGDAALKRVYELTSNMPMNPFMIAEAITAALKEEGFESTVEPTVITDEQLETYLEVIASKEQDLGKLKALLSSVIPSDGMIQTSKHRVTSNPSLEDDSIANFETLFNGGSVSAASTCPSEPDGPNLYPEPSKFLSPLAIQLIIDYFRYSRSPFVPVLPTNDIRDITGCDPIELNEFFMMNRRQFH